MKVKGLTPSEDEEKQIFAAADLGLHSLKGIDFSTDTNGQQDWYLYLLLDFVKRLRSAWEQPDPAPMARVSYDEIRIAALLLDELAARVEPPSAPVTEATVAMSTLAREVSASLRSHIAQPTPAQPTPAQPTLLRAGPPDGADLGQHMLSGSSLKSAAPVLPVLLEDEALEALRLIDQKGQQPLQLDLGTIVVVTSLLAELDGRLKPPSAPTTPGTEALRKALDRLSDIWSDLLFS